VHTTDPGSGPTGCPWLPIGRAAGAGLVVTAVLLLTGCSAAQLERGYLPAQSQGATDQTGRITDLWVGSWVAALILGAVVWGLTLWVIMAYRRRRADEPLPSQFRYHVPIEVMYTAVPTIVVLVLFYFTARDQAAILSLDDESGAPDMTVAVTAKQWTWEFAYPDHDVYSIGRQAELQSPGDPRERIPTLYLPAGERVEFVLYARDVNHSFWIPAFLFKMDNIAGRENRFRVTPLEEGVYEGRCAELCGEYHAEMLFNVEVMSPAEFEEQMAALRDAGRIGSLPADLGRSKPIPDYNGGGVRGTGPDQEQGTGEGD
jgi:cytochrome c oxidase subunit 2